MVIPWIGKAGHDGQEKNSKKNNGHTRGSSLMYVVLLMTLLAVLSSGYMAISRYNMKAALKNRRYMEAQLSAKTIHRSFCEAVSSGESPSMDLIWQTFPGRLRPGKRRI